MNIDEMQKLLDDLPKIETPEYTRMINVFKQLRLSETEHSRIICDLINPNNHLIDYGKQFLELFFKYVLHDDEFKYNEKDQWEVVAEEGRYDIWIRSKDNSKIIIIENKANGANDQPNQLYRYWYHGIHWLQKDMDDKNKYGKILYLSPSKFKIYDKQSITKPDYIKERELYNQLDEEIIQPVFFNKEILLWLEECMKIVENKDSLYYYLLQYRDFWRSSMHDKEIVNLLDKYFEGKEKGMLDNFCELSNQKAALIDSWYLHFGAALKERFQDEKNEHVYEAWEFEGWNYDWHWSLKDYGRDCIRINIDSHDFELWINPEKIDSQKANRLLLDHKYCKILEAFDKPQGMNLTDSQAPIKIVEKDIFSLNDIDNRPISPEFAWYARYRTKEVVEQILRKINRFRNPEITTLLKELIEETRKDKND
jgi:hypothetical protein